MKTAAALRTRTHGSDEAMWQIAGPCHIGLLRARYVRQSFPRHSHDSFVVCVNQRGAHVSWYRGATVVIPERVVSVVPPGEVHTGQALPGHAWHYRAMYPDTALMASLGEAVGLPGTVPSFTVLSVNDGPLSEAFLRAHRRCETPLDPLERDGSLADVLMTLLRRHATGPLREEAHTRPTHAIQRAVDFIRDCYAERLTLNGLAAAAGLSRYAVLRAFGREMGIPPYAFVTQVRIEHARRLLGEGVPIGAVSQRVGFADQSHLTRHFKHLLGITPGAYVRAVRPPRAYGRRDSGFGSAPGMDEEKTHAGGLPADIRWTGSPRLPGTVTRGAIAPLD